MKPLNRSLLLLAVMAAGTLLAAGGQAAPEPLADRVPAALPDLLRLPSPSAVKLEGYLGERVAKNEQNRLLEVDVDRLLAGFRKRPGEHPWIGEHIGKWMHASTLAWANTGDPELRKKLDYAAAELIKTQEPDGYLGTYLPEKRFGLYRGADWDVWSHKYNLLGLLTYYQYTGNAPALEASRKMADLLIRTFGPGKKSILAAGTHVGMASTSVLEPMVQLYRLTGEPRYLEFAKYIVSSWDEPKGPRVLQTLLTEKSVAKTANGKAYEMLSNLVGLCELARVTGDRQYLQAPINAWEDVTAHQLYLTGSTSHGEHFGEPYDLPNQMGANVGETCVTVTWIQLNTQLLRLTGDARYGDELERSYYNHLAAAQRPDGKEWCYYTSLEGTKPYGPGINCCVSSGPRGMALAPQVAYLQYRDGANEGIVVNLYDSSHATLAVAGGNVTVEQRSNFPGPRRPEEAFSGKSTLVLHPQKASKFGLKFRVPKWSEAFRVRSGGKELREATTGWITVPARKWKDGDKIEVTFLIPARVIAGEHTNSGKSAFLWGPIVLAYDDKLNPGLPSGKSVGLGPDVQKPPLTLQPVEGVPLAFRASIRTGTDDQPHTATLVPFAEAGSTGGRYQVWLRGPGQPLPVNPSLLGSGQESRSRPGNVAGSINDGELDTFVVTFNTEAKDEDWFAVQLDQPVTVRRIVYAHGRTFHDGGWFDASAAKPRIEVQREKDGPWVAVGVLDSYPATTATDAKGLRDGQTFTLKLAAPEKVVAVRVIGKPAVGDNPRQSFSSCAELQALPE